MSQITSANLLASSGVAGKQFAATRMHTSRILQYAFLARRLAATGLRTLSLKFALGHFCPIESLETPLAKSKRLFTVSAQSLNPIDNIPFFDVFYKLSQDVSDRMDTSNHPPWLVESPPSPMMQWV